MEEIAESEQSLDSAMLALNPDLIDGFKKSMEKVQGEEQRENGGKQGVASSKIEFATNLVVRGCTILRQGFIT